MRSMYTGKFFVMAIRKKQDLYNFFKQIDTKSIDDINNSKFPMWWRERFIELKNQDFKWSPENEESLIKNNQPLEYTLSQDKTGKVYKVLKDIYVKVSKSEILFEYDEIFQVLDDELLHGSSNYGKIKDMNYLLTNSQYLCDTTSNDYRELYKKHLLNKHQIKE